MMVSGCTPSTVSVNLFLYLLVATRELAVVEYAALRCVSFPNLVDDFSHSGLHMYHFRYNPIQYLLKLFSLCFLVKGTLTAPQLGTETRALEAQFTNPYAPLALFV